MIPPESDPSGRRSPETTDLVAIPINGELDLHTFRPGKIMSLLSEYISTCQNQGILHIRIIHGKGTGTLRETVHSLLRNHPSVIDFRLGGDGQGGWGATVAQIKPAR